MLNQSAARIVSLDRYILLLRQEEKRLKWITDSTRATSVENIDAAANLKVISQKLTGAERERFDLALGPGR